MIQVDLGCGNRRSIEPGVDQYIGVDKRTIGAITDKVCNIGFEPLPFDDDSIDIVTAYDFLEHVPFQVYVQKDAGMETKSPMVFLFNEIYRILKPLGIFYMQTPCYPDQKIFQDPTHVSVWTPETLHYFTGDYYGTHTDYGHTSRFEIMRNGMNLTDGHIHARLRARKDINEHEQFQVIYREPII